MKLIRLFGCSVVRLFVRDRAACSVVACVAALVMPPVARAQVVPQVAAPLRYVDPTGGLSIDELVATALKTEPQLAAARTEIDVARGDLRQGGLRPNPAVSADRQEEVGGTDHRTMINVEVPLDLFRRAGRVATAQRMVDVAALSVEDRGRLLAAAVREQAGRALAEARTLGVMADLLAVARRSRDLLQARVSEGAAPTLDLQMVELDVRRFEAQFALATGRVETAFIELRAAAGIDPDAPLALHDSLEAVVTSQPRERSASAALDTVVSRRTDVREAVARVDLAAARIDQKRREGRVDIAVYGSYMTMDAGFPQRGFDDRGGLTRVRGIFHTVTFGAMVSVPLWNRNQGSIAAAEAERAGAERTQAARTLAARAEIAAASARERFAQQAVEVYVSSARDLARRNLDVVREAYELGRTRLFDLLAEQRRVLETEMAFTDALAEAYQARIAVQKARGDVR